MPTVTAFKWVPPFAQGSVRDIRVRWALEEAGLTYDDRLLGFEDTTTPEYRALQPTARSRCSRAAPSCCGSPRVRTP